LRRRVFVSYKRKADTGATGDSEVLADQVQAGLTDYTVFRDKQIAPGAEWHREIDRGLALAHAAVVLLTESALKSQWVQYELAVLSFRARNAAPPFRLLVALVGVDPGALQQPPFNAIKLDALQLFVKRRATDVAIGRNEYEDEAGLCAKLIAELQTELPAQPSNIEKLLADVVKALEKYAWVCDDMEKHLQLAPVAEDQRLQRLAEELLRLRLGDFHALFQVLAARDDVPARQLDKVLNLMFQFWVSGQLATELVLVSDPERRAIAALKSGDRWTAEQVVRRAEELPRFWKIADARLPGGEHDVAAAVSQALEEIAAVQLPDDERATLARPLDPQKVMPLLDETVANWIWFVLVDTVEAADQLLALGRRWLRPILFTAEPPATTDARVIQLPLEREREETARKTFKRIVHLIKNAQGQGS
jgi:hypothetical protein